jgi:hypothetical protein
MEVAQFWSTNTGLKRCAIAILLASAGFQPPFGAMIAVRIKQMEGTFSPLAYTELIATGAAVVAIVLPAISLAAASFRPERDPQITQALNDISWLLLVMNWPAATVQCLAIGFAILGYRGARAVWPRWLAYYNLWCAFLFLAAGVWSCCSRQASSPGTGWWRSGWSWCCSGHGCSS